MPRRPPFFASLIILALIFVFGSGMQKWIPRSAPKPPPRTGETISGRPRVVDGDTLDVAGHRIRLFGIDAAESRQTCRDGRGRAYACGAEARRALIVAIRGNAVSCTPVGESYGRDVAICMAGSRDLSEVMVRNGNAIELPQHSNGRYADAEREARSAKRGLWAGDFQQPADWRHAWPR